MANETTVGTAADGMTWVFTGDVEFEVHRPGCSRIRANVRKGRVAVVEVEDKQDLLDREYEARICNCARRAR